MTEQSSIYQIWPKKFWFIKYDQRKLDLSNMTEESSIYQIRPKTVRFIKYDRRKFDLSNMTEEISIYQIWPKKVRFIKYDRRQFDLLTMTEDNWLVFRKIWKNFKLKYDADSASVSSYCLNTQNMSFKTQPKSRSSLITEITLLHSFVQIILQINLV